MEPEGALRVFSRSIEKHQLLYTEYFGDGDSKSFNLVKDQYNIYDIEVQKKECVGHVQKRLGTALRKLNKEKRAWLGKVNLQTIWLTGCRTTMVLPSEVILAIFLLWRRQSLPVYFTVHPQKIDSCICSIAQRVPIAGVGFSEIVRTEQIITNMVLGCRDVIEELKPVYSRLSEDNLLSRCLDGKTQNQNESLNGMF